MERCPCCNARLTGAKLCPRCQADLGSFLGCVQLARQWLSKALQFWLADEPQMAILALSKSIYLKQTPLALVFRDFIIRQQCQSVLGLLEKKEYTEAKESLSQLRDLNPDNKFLMQLFGFTKYLLVKDIIKLSTCKQSESSMSSNLDSTSSPCIRNCCLNDDNICLGCFRSINEISLWTQVDEKTRHHFLNNAESRQKAHSNKVLL